MAVAIIGVAALACLSGSARGLIGSFVGAVLGTLAAAGMVRMVADGNPVAVAELMVSALAIGVVGLGVTVVAPYLTGAIAAAWTIGSLVGVTVALDAGWVGYVAPLLMHAAVAALLLRRCRSLIARRLA